MTLEKLDDFDQENNEFSEDEENEMKGFHEVGEDEETDDIEVKKIQIEDDDDDYDDSARNDW